MFRRVNKFGHSVQQVKGADCCTVVNIKVGIVTCMAIYRILDVMMI
jgi:hypothetical protein